MDAPNETGDATYPRGYRAVAAAGQPEGRPELFDPALREYRRGFRLGDPDFARSESRQVWVEARRHVADHLLRLVASSPWWEHLVLRGSLLLKAWLEDAAREPGDIDWVFCPADVAMDSSTAQTLIADLIRLAQCDARVGDTVLLAEQITVDDIWTYERAAGKRLVFPFQVADLPTGYVQMDIVFGEELFAEPAKIVIPSSKVGEGILVWGATKEMSLAWKLLWLQTDGYPQGKDLYDATLLAEQTRLPRELLDRVLQTSESASDWDFYFDSPTKWEVDWANFQLECPWVLGTAAEWQKRLSVALLPTTEQPSTRSQYSRQGLP